MRVQQYLAHTGPGGALTVARVLDEHLASVGIRSSVHPVFVAEGDEPAAGAARLSAGLRRVARRLREDRPAAVVSHTPSAALLVNLVAWLARVPRRVVVQHASADVLSCPVRLVDRFFGRVGLHTDVVFVGQAVLDSFGALPPRYRLRTRVIRNGIDPGPAADVAAPAWPGPGLRLLVVGRLDRDKSVATAVEACAAVPGRAALVVLGDGPERGPLEALAARLGADVRFAGQASGPEVAAHYAAADVLLFPTRSEALPLVLVEALVAGLPVVASDIPPNREVLDDVGCFAPVGDVAAWTGAVRALADDPDLLADMSRRGRLRAAGFRRAPMLAAYEDLLRGTR